MSTTDDADDIDLPALEDDAVSTGAAADSSDWDERLKDLPRLLRYSMLITDGASHVEQRVIAEIDELWPSFAATCTSISTLLAKGCPISIWATSASGPGELRINSGLFSALTAEHRLVSWTPPPSRCWMR